MDLVRHDSPELVQAIAQLRETLGGENEAIEDLIKSLLWLKSLPTPNFLADVVNAGFQASLLKYEGAEIKATIALCDRDATVGAVELKKPLPLTATSIRSLASAVDFAESAVAVERDINGSLVLWGILLSFPIKAITIRIRGVGEIGVCHGDEIYLLASATRGLLLPGGATRHGCIKVIASSFGNDKQFVENYQSASCIMTIADQMRQLGHGGTLLVVNSKSADWRESISDVQFETKVPFSGVGTLVDQLNVASKQAHEEFAAAFRQTSDKPGSYTLPNATSLLSTELSRRLREHLATIGNLTIADGAVVMCDDLSLVGFGAKLVVKLDLADIEMVVGGYGNHSDIRPFNEQSLLGMRHRSAAAFVASHHDSIALVQSQDGRLTLIAWIASPGQLAFLRLNDVLI